MGKTGLVLEGGGMRGLFTAGVLDLFLEKGITFPYVIGVSAGVCHGISYVAGQPGRTRRINLENVRNGRYVGLRNLMKTGSMFGMDYIFDEIPNKLYPFDFKTYFNSPTEFVAGVTDVATGGPVYFGKADQKDINLIARASSAIPVFSPIVEYGEGKYLDGGTSDPIPAEKALRDGCDRIVAVLTRDRTFVRSPEKFRRAYARLYRRYPEMVRCLDERHKVYNRSLELLRKLEKEKKALVIAPPRPVLIGRFERNPEKLDQLYRCGYEEAGRLCGSLISFLEEKNAEE